MPDLLGGTAGGQPTSAECRARADPAGAFHGRLDRGIPGACCSIDLLAGSASRPALRLICVLDSIRFAFKGKRPDAIKRRISSMSRYLCAASLAAILFAATPALAHVELQADQAPAGSSYRAVLMVPHGCAGAATTGLRVQIPEGVMAVKPMAKPGWKIALKTGKLAQPIEIEGETITEAVTEIDWSGGNLPDAFYDEFVFVGTLPDKPGTVIYFPTIQQCAKSETRWIELQAAGQSSEDLKAPAPSLTLGPKEAGGN
jgi:uncharacterized protein YcnI